MCIFHSCCPWFKPILPTYKQSQSGIPTFQQMNIRKPAEFHSLSQPYSGVNILATIDEKQAIQ